MIDIGFPLQFRSFFVVTVVAAMWLALNGCEKKPTPPPDSASPTSPASTSPASVTTPPLRLISLSPALTDMLIDLGFEDFVVGRGRWDEQLSEEIPRVGDLASLDLEAILMLDPTDILLQAGDQGTPPALRGLAEEQGWKIINVQIDGLSDIRRVAGNLPGLLSLPSESQAAEMLIAGLDQALTPLTPEDATSLGPILMLYGMEPPSAFGPGSYLSDIVEQLGGVNAIESGGAWQELDLEAVLTLDPWAIVVVSSRGSFDGLESDAQLLPSSWDRFDLRAVTEGRVAALTHPQALLPGTCVIDVAGEIRMLLESWANEAREKGSN